MRQSKSAIAVTLWLIDLVLLSDALGS
jgi:hypothetical protein